MARQSQAWKNLERQTAKELDGRRITRGGNFAVSDVDVVVDAHPELRIDCKYRTSHSHHSLMAAIERKYCARPGDVPVLVTKHHNQESAYVTIPLQFFGRLLRDRSAVLGKQQLRGPASFGVGAVVYSGGKGQAEVDRPEGGQVPLREVQEASAGTKATRSDPCVRGLQGGVSADPWTTKD